MASAVFLLLSALLTSATGDHVMGGYLAWWPTGEPGQVRFTYEVIVRREGENTKCNEFNLGVFTVEGNTDIVASGSGLQDNTVLARNTYVCTGFSREEGVVQGEGSFTYIFPDPSGVYTVRLDECCLPSYADDSEFVLMTLVDLRARNDTGVINSPPVSSTPPLVYLTEGCPAELHLLVADNDGDSVRCRQAVGTECGTSGCVPYPSWVVLNSSSCTLRFTNPQLGNAYLSVTLEDFPLGSDTPITAVPIRLTVSVLSSNRSCSSKPTFDQFVTPSDGSCDTVQEGRTFTTYILTTPPAGESISELLLSGPAGLTVTRNTQTNGDVLFVVQWTPSTDQYGTHVLSYLAIDSSHRSSEIRFLTIYTGVVQVALETGSNLPNTLVTPDNKEFNISFNQKVQLSAVRRLIYLEQRTPERRTVEVIDVSSSQQVRVSDNTLLITTSADLTLGEEYSINLENGVVVPFLSCPQQPAQTGLILPSSFDWTFTTGYGPCYQNCSQECLPEQWERDLCNFYSQLGQWSRTAAIYGLEIPSITPSQSGTPDEQWAEARRLWEEITGIWNREAMTKGFVVSGGSGSVSAPPGSPLNGQWVLSLNPWYAGQQFWESTVGVSLGVATVTATGTQPDEWGDLLSNWTRGAQVYYTTHSRSP